MLKKILLAGAALATLSVPVAADAQYYGRTYGTYSHARHYYWDGHHYRDRNNNAVIDALIGGVLGYAIGSATSRSNYGYAYPSYSYSYPSYGYGYSRSYSYPSYGYGYQYSYPSYGYSGYCSYYRC
jgi:CubicO group peptidase (beta-lactamase class C family)